MTYRCRLKIGYPRLMQCNNTAGMGGFPNRAKQTERYDPGLKISYKHRN